MCGITFQQLECKYKKDAKTVKNFLKVVGNHYGISENFGTFLEKFPRDITTYIMNISLPL